MDDAADSARIRSQRPAKSKVDPWRPLDVLVEVERDTSCQLRPSITVFLAGSECPFTCVFCDLWRFTIDEPTPVGAIPRQLEIALGSLEPDGVADSIKLYNASNFFERNAVPPQDLAAIAERLSSFRRVIVECHPRLVGDSCLRFAEMLTGRLEVAMGLETIHPIAQIGLNKQMTLDDFARAAKRLQDNGIGVRAFTLLSPPFVPARESVDWTVRTVRFAFEEGVTVVSIIPIRGGNGEMERLAELGLFVPPTLALLEEAMVRAVDTAGGVVLADLWDVERMAGCPICQEARVAHLVEMNRTGVVDSLVDCSACRSRTGEKG